MVYSSHTVDAPKINGGIRVPVCIEGTTFDMQLDTTADVSLLPESLYRKLLSHLPLLPAGIVLKTYENQTVDMAGKIMVNVQYEDQGVNLPLIIVKGADKAALFGLQWLEHIKLNWQKVCCMQGFVSGVLVKHSEVFGEGLGMLKGTTDKIYVVSDQPPRFFKPWSVPYALKKRVEEELDRLVQTKVIDPVRNSDWATPIMPILKADGKVRVSETTN